MKLEDIKPLHKVVELPYEPYIVIVLTEAQLSLLPPELLLEGGWRPSGEGDLWVRVNPPKPQMNLPANAHVAHNKHLSAKDKQVSWEASAGKRHDRMTFDKNFSPMEMAKKVARAALSLPSDFPMEQLSQDLGKSLLLESEATSAGRIYLLACVQTLGV
ncbi:DUF6367 family protein [Methylomonas methanica]|uniref:Uncharacterized protein n=1 Tax=Methylomonas methanica (strain DSM 25384 / MC09) TaxID=857087 RepID=G0A4T6_METMM|nr:DUF6367 family protein [Methylomonas methanica]AEG02827.1 hypothetical protein Metme_4487 [Methylomonas methanica MC09]